MYERFNWNCALKSHNRAGKKTKLRNVKYPVSLRLAAVAGGNVSLVVSVSLGGSKR